MADDPKPAATLALVPPPKTHVMIDVETFAKDSALPVLLSLGAVKFNGSEIVDKFEVGIDPADCQRFGLEMEADTVVWWLDDARREAWHHIQQLGKVDLYAALDGFAMWVSQTPADQLGSVWSNGSNFDNAKLKSIFQKTGIEWPFSYKQEECYRTLRNRFGDAVPFQRLGIHHGALDDAHSQASHMIGMAAHGAIEL